MSNQKQCAIKKFACIHGHFYQPPRENAWLEIIESQDSASPFHDWNERINFECYAPNAAARLHGEGDLIRKIGNNYASISFNFGPTLLSWLQTADPATYRRILDADKLSVNRFGGHGNAIAQAYNHLIMPLANERDKLTQVLWGIADFEHRFQRKPEGMWLPEAAVDTETLEILADQGIRFTILAPRQAKAYRKIGDPAWTPLHENIDPRRAYLCKLPDGKSIAVFFYDGNVAQEVAFKGLLHDGASFALRLAGTLDNGNGNGEVQLAHIATDGESYGHHHRFGEMALASALDFIEENELATLTNYGEFLKRFPPKFEVQIHENSSWSCVHGVERWRSDCGCNTGGKPHWNQAWRSPLREALDWLRDELLVLYQNEAVKYVADPWAARNDYIQVILKRGDDMVNTFLQKHARQELAKRERTKLLQLLEMQRHAMLMYTSCAWFFDEVSGIETDQVLQYALRAMSYANYVAEVDLLPEFTARLEKIPSNVHENGAVSFRQNVQPAQMSLSRVGMHYAASTIFEDYPESAKFLHYEVSNEVFERIPAGSLRLAMGRTTLVSQITYSERSFSFVALYLGQHHMTGSISLNMEREIFDLLQTQITGAFRHSNLGDVLALMQTFGGERFSFNQLFKDEKRKILRQLVERSLPPVETAIHDYYDDNYQLMTAMQESDIPLPSGWRSIVNYVSNRELRRFFENGRMNVQQLKFIVSEFEQWDVEMEDYQGLQLAVGERIFLELQKIADEQLSDSKVRVEHLLMLISALEGVQKLGIEPDFWKSQNLYFHLATAYKLGERVYASESWKKAFFQLGKLLKMSQP